MRTLFIVFFILGQLTNLIGSKESDPICPEGLDTTLTICPLYLNLNNLYVSFGLPSNGFWQPSLEFEGDGMYFYCTDSASVYIYTHTYPGCPDVFDTIHFVSEWNLCNWEPEDLCSTEDSFYLTIPSIPGSPEDTYYTILIPVEGNDPIYGWVMDTFDFDSTYELSFQRPEWWFQGACVHIDVSVNGPLACFWSFGGFPYEDGLCFPECTCNDPPYAGENNSISVCFDDVPFDLTTVIGGNPDDGGTWSPPLSSGGNIYDPSIDGAGIYIYSVSNLYCPIDMASVTVAVINVPIVILGIPPTICETSDPISLPTTQNGISGEWSGPGVSINIFDPTGLDGSIDLLFTPDPGQCAMNATTDINVESEITVSINDVPDILCEAAGLLLLPVIESGIHGNWSGSGVSNNTFDPNGLSGDITLTFIPDAGECASSATTSINVMPASTLTITGVPDQLCANEGIVVLPIVQSGIYGNWTGPGVYNNMFDPDGLSGNITLTFLPESGECAYTATTTINVIAAVTPVITGIPDSICEQSGILVLPASVSGITGNWSGNNVNNNLFDPIGLNGFISLTFTPEAGQCANGNSTLLFSIAPAPPLLTGIPNSICESSTPLSLPIPQDGINGSWYGTGVTGNIITPSGLSGFVILSFVPDTGQCADTASTQVLISTPPSFQHLMESCDSLSQTYRVSFDITGGDSTGYTVNGIPQVEPHFISIPVNADSMNYSFLLDDANGCGPVSINGSANCSCATHSGTMDFNGSPINICDGELVNVIHHHDEYLDINDVFLFILHDLPGTQIGNIYAINDSSIFLVPPGIEYEKTYYVSAAAGPDSGTGNIDWSDSCLSVSPGVPVIFHMASEARVDMALCAGDSLQINGVIYNEIHPVGVETIPGGNIHGCDSTIYVQLSYNPTSVFQVDQQLCDGESIMVNVTAYNQLHPQGTEVLNNGSEFGCDSIIHVSLSYYPATWSEWKDTLCFGSSITIHNTVYNESNPSGTEVFSDQHGCDSTLFIRLTFDSTITEEFFTILCPGESLVINGITYDEANPSGTLSIPGGSVLGCDSVLNINLSYYPHSFSVLDTTLCKGESLLVNGVEFNELNLSGTEVLTDASITGCDSTIQIELTYYPDAKEFITDTFQAGDSVVINGTVFDQFNPSGTAVITGGSTTGCDSTIIVALTFSSPISVVMEYTMPSCHGAVDASVLIYEIAGGQMPYTVMLDQYGAITPNTWPVQWENLKSGLHQLTIRDVHGEVMTLEITISDPPVLVVDAGPDQDILQGDDALLNQTSSQILSSWWWTPPDFLSCVDCPNPIVIHPEYDVTYSLLVTDENGCSASDEVSITLKEKTALYIPTVFSPNGDGFNDVLPIYASSDIKTIKALRFYSRWGELISEHINVDPDTPGIVWDGTYRGNAMNPGVYIWLAEVEYNNGREKRYQGDVTLLR